MRHALVSLLLLGCSGPARPTAGPAAGDPPRTEPAAQQPPGDKPIAGELEPAPAGTATASQPGTQAEIAASLNEEAKRAIYDQRYAEASAKLKQAIARVPDPRYFLNLCMSLFFEGKFSESLTACNAVESSGGTAELLEKARKMIARIQEEAKRQGISLDRK